MCDACRWRLIANLADQLLEAGLTEADQDELVAIRDQAEDFAHIDADEALIVLRMWEEAQT